MKKLWFKRKHYGWGWYPATWQGWVVTAVYVAAIVGLSFVLSEDATPRDVNVKFLVPLIAVSIVFVGMAYLTGEKPKWQWGIKDDKKSDK